MSVGYQRKRALGTSVFEGNVVAVGLLVGGIAVAAIILWEVFHGLFGAF